MTTKCKIGIFFALMAQVWAFVARADVPEGVIWPEGKSYQFGLVRESQGKVRGDVHFVNTSASPVRVGKVRSSCGCTVPDPPKHDVAPGDTASIGFVYDPVRRPGRFEKRLKVYFEGCPTPEEIWIRGTVLGEDSSLRLKYPVILGPLRLEADTIFGGYMAMGTSKHQFVTIYNQSTDTIAPHVVSDHEAMETSLLPAAIPPGDIGTVRLSFNTRRGAVLGENIAIVTLLLPESPQKESATPPRSLDLVYRAEVYADPPAEDTP